MKHTVYDCLVVGSGCAGAMVAQTLVEAGREVTMVDVGVTDPSYSKLIPDMSYLKLRQTDPEQYKYLIGSQAEGVTWGNLSKGAQVTPPRQYISQAADEYSPIISKTFSPLQSLGYGGLGIGWGLQCWEFSEAELTQAGLPAERMRTAYETVSRRIGISATKDAASPYTMGSLQTYQPSVEADRNHRRIQERYLADQAWFERHKVYVGRTPLALLSQAQDGRKAYRYRDLDFYSDQDESAWRPWITINRLKRKANFTYRGGLLAIRFRESGQETILECLDLSTRQIIELHCKRLVLCAGAINSGRLALRSQGSASDRLPLLCNPYTYLPCIQPGLFGQAAEDRKLGFGQLSMFIDPEDRNMDISIGTFYSYQSLMLFRIIRQVPLDFADARTIMQYLMSGFLILGIQHTDWPSAQKYLRLSPDSSSPTGDRLHARYTLGKADQARQHAIEQQYVKAARRLGVYALKRLYPGHGSSVHYAGSLPFSEHDIPLTLADNGRLHGTKRVYVADSAGFTFLPARGLTFSILANAHLTAENILHES